MLDEIAAHRTKIVMEYAFQWVKSKMGRCGEALKYHIEVLHFYDVGEYIYTHIYTHTLYIDLGRRGYNDVGGRIYMM